MTITRGYHYTKVPNKVLSDPDYRTLPDDTKARYLGMCILAMESDAGGIIIKENDAPFTLKDISMSLYCDSKLLSKSIDILIDAGFVSFEDDVYEIVRFENEQGAERASANGDKKKAEWKKKKSDWRENRRKLKLNTNSINNNMSNSNISSNNNNNSNSNINNNSINNSNSNSKKTRVCGSDVPYSDNKTKTQVVKSEENLEDDVVLETNSSLTDEELERLKDYNGREVMNISLDVDELIDFNELKMKNNSN